jgi:hypothetical protein
MGPTELTVLLPREVVINKLRRKCRYLLDYVKNSVFGYENRNY